MTPRKSSYDLSEIAYLKVPKSIYEKYVKIAEKRDMHWSELARKMLDGWISQFDMDNPLECQEGD